MFGDDEFERVCLSKMRGGDMTKLFMILLATVLFTIGFSQETKAQWLDGKVALRTNGNNFQSGDRLKVADERKLSCRNLQSLVSIRSPNSPEPLSCVHEKYCHMVSPVASVPQRGS